MHKIKTNYEIIKIHAKNALVYRANVFGSLILFMLYLFIFSSLWKYVLADSTIAGYSLNQMTWYLVCTEFIMIACRTDIFFTINNDVQTGSIVYAVNRPVNYVHYQCLRNLGNMLVTGSLFIGLSLILGFTFTKSLPNITITQLPFFILSLVLGIGIQFFSQMCIAVTAFYFGENIAFLLIYQKLIFLLGGFFPTEFLMEWIQRISELLPFQYIAGSPAKLLASYSWSLFTEIIVGQIIYLVFFVLLTYLLFKAGIRKLQIYGG